VAVGVFERIRARPRAELFQDVIGARQCQTRLDNQNAFAVRVEFFRDQAYALFLKRGMGTDRSSEILCKLVDLLGCFHTREPMRLRHGDSGSGPRWQFGSQGDEENQL
jgi:hypothetical protein